ncbi:MAG: Fe-S protein assembly co-chaperone HscB [Myxococcota bacterium]
MSDPFETLGLEPRFELDLGVLETRQRELSRALHPDRYAGRGAAERRQALSRAIEVNDAVRVVKDPLRRADALLRRHGVALDEQDAGAQPPPHFLMEVLELRDELGTARRVNDLARVAQLERSFSAREAALLSDVSQAFSALSASGDWSRAEVEPIAKKLGELRYVRRLLDEARSIQDELV